MSAPNIEDVRRLYEDFQFNEALRAAEDLICRGKSLDVAWCFKACCLVQTGRAREALTAIRRAATINPHSHEIRYHQSLILLTRGRYRRGWELYESRLHREGDGMPRPPYQAAPWLGRTTIRNKRILIQWEQGFGDTIQFLRYALVLASMGANVIAAVQPELQELTRTIKGIEEVLVHGDPVNSIQEYCPLPSLPHALGTTLQSIPSAPYIFADAILADAIDLPAGSNVGLAWYGRRTHYNDRNRSMQLDQIEPLLAVNSVNFINLQQEPANHPRIVEISSRKTFSETAAVISRLDLTISVDTAVAHLAGAMGKPVWILLPFAADFRWMEQRIDSPWYPSARLFRQPTIGDWRSVIATVQAALKAATAMASVRTSLPAGVVHAKSNSPADESM